MPENQNPGGPRREHEGPRAGRIHRRLSSGEEQERPIELFSEAELADEPGTPPAAPQTEAKRPAGPQHLYELRGLLEGEAPAGPKPEPTPHRPTGSLGSLDELQGLLGDEANSGYADGDDPADDLDEYLPEEPGRKPGKGKAGKAHKKSGGKEAPYKHQRPKGKFSFRRVFTLKRVLLGILALFFVGVVSFGFFFVYVTRNDDLWMDLETIAYKDATILYCNNPQTGQQEEWFRLPATQNKEYVPLKEIPDNLKNAFVAVEDKKFYEHWGVDIKRTTFAVVNEGIHAVTGVYIGGRKQGASTIDQQLIKNLTRDDADSSMSGYMRKLREVCRAFRLDALYDKDEILEAYLNVIGFTGNTAGVQAEAKKLFGRPVGELTLAECASLTAITRNPARYNPNTNPEEHLERRNYVLGEMLSEEYITQAQHDAAVAEPLNLTGDPEPRLDNYVTDYFTDTVISEVITRLTEDYNLTRREASNLLYNGGLRIHTTVNPQLQRAMEQMMEDTTYHPQTKATAVKQLVDSEGNPMVDENDKAVMGETDVTPQAAIISLDYDGGIAAVVGGLGEKEISRGFNRATQAVRQVGSTMKPIGPYVTALEDNKITWASPFMDSAVMQLEDEDTGAVSDWPSNVDNRYSGRDILVREGISRSVNTVAVRVGQLAGVNRMYNFVTKDLDIQSFTKDDKDLGPLVLGSSTYGISPLDMAKAYAMFGNGGYMVTPHSYTKITSGNGSLMVQNNTPHKKVISEDTAYIMNRLLRNVLTDGTAAGMSVPGSMDSVGKTGTTSDNRDHWFIGLTPYYVTSSWYGYDENIPLRVNNSRHPATLSWRASMQAGQEGLPTKEFPTTDKVTEYTYCTQSGAIPGSACPTASGWFKYGHGPKGQCTLHAA